MHRRFSRPSPAMVVALLALFVALGGTSVAAVSLKKNSVGSSQIKNSSLTGRDIKNSSLTTSDVKNRSLLARDFKAGQLPSGARGATGPQGAAGATNVVLRTGSVPIPANSQGGFSGTASCHTGERATGGGAVSSSAATGDTFGSNIPVPDPENPSAAIDPPAAGVTPTGWAAFYHAASPVGTDRTITIYAVCTSP